MNHTAVTEADRAVARRVLERTGARKMSRRIGDTRTEVADMFFVPCSRRGWLRPILVRVGSDALLAAEQGAAFGRLYAGRINA